MKKAASKIEPKISGTLSKEIEGLFRDGVLVDLNIGMWTALQRNTKEDLGLDAPDAPPVPDFIVGLGTKRLVDHKLAKTWTSIAGHARNVLRHKSMLFPLGETHFVPLGALPDVFEKLEECKQAYERAWRSGLLKDFDKLREDFLAQYSEHRTRLEHLFPSRENVERRFYFEYSAFTVSVPKQLRVAAFNKKKQEEQEAAMRRYQQQLDRRVTEFLSESVTTLRAKAVEICTNVAASVRDGKTVTDKSIARLSSFIEQFRTLNFVGDHEVEGRFSKLKKDILDGNDADAFADDEALRKALASACDDITKAAAAVTDVSSVTGSYRRKIVLD